MNNSKNSENSLSPSSEVINVESTNSDLSLKDRVGDAANNWLAKNRSLSLRQTPVWAQSLTLILIWNPIQTVLHAGRESLVCLLNIPSLQNFVKRIQSAHLKDFPEFPFCLFQLELNPLRLSQPSSGSVVCFLSFAPKVRNLTSGPYLEVRLKSTNPF